MSLFNFSKENPWVPGNRDPLFLSERIGNWQWYWVLATVTASSVIYYYAFQYVWKVLYAVAIWTETEGDFLSYINDWTKISDNIYSLIIFGVAGVVQISIGILLLSIHRRHFFSGLTFNVSLSWVPFWKAGAAYGLSLLLFMLIYLIFYPEQFTVQSPGTQYYILLLGLGAALLLVQTLGEEILFRGYMFRVIGAVFPYRLALVLLVSMMFTYEHINNPDIRTDKWFLVIVFFSTELVFYWVLLRTRTVMSTWGLHWFNNVIAFLILNVQPGYKNEIALFTYTDPILSKGGTYLYDPLAYLSHAVFLGLFITLIVWKRSPFYLPKAEQG